MNLKSTSYPFEHELSQEHAKLAEWLINPINAQGVEINKLSARSAAFELRITELENVAGAAAAPALDDTLRPAFGAVLDAIVYIADMEGGADRRRILQRLEPLADLLNREGEREGMKFSRLHVRLMNELAERGEFVGWPNDDVLAALGQLRLWGYVAEGWQGEQPRWWLLDAGRAAMEAERERVQCMLSPVGESESAEPVAPEPNEREVERERLLARKERRARLDWLQRETLRHGAWRTNERGDRMAAYPFVDADALRLLKLIPHKYTLTINQGIDGFAIRVIEQSDHGNRQAGRGTGETFAEAMTDAWVAFKADEGR